MDLDFDMPTRFSPTAWQALVSSAEARLEAGEKPSGEFWERVVDDANERLEAHGDEIDIDDLDSTSRQDVLAATGHDVEQPELPDVDDFATLDDGLAGLEPASFDYEHDDLRY